MNSDLGQIYISIEARGTNSESDEVASSEVLLVTVKEHTGRDSHPTSASAPPNCTATEIDPLSSNILMLQSLSTMQPRVQVALIVTFSHLLEIPTHQLALSEFGSIDMKLWSQLVEHYNPQTLRTASILTIFFNCTTGNTDKGRTVASSMESLQRLFLHCYSGLAISESESVRCGAWYISMNNLLLAHSSDPLPKHTPDLPNRHDRAKRQADVIIDKYVSLSKSITESASSFSAIESTVVAVSSTLQSSSVTEAQLDHGMSHSISASYLRPDRSFQATLNNGMQTDGTDLLKLTDLTLGLPQMRPSPSPTNDGMLTRVIVISEPSLVLKPTIVPLASTSSSTASSITDEFNDLDMLDEQNGSEMFEIESTSIVELLMTSSPTSIMFSIPTDIEIPTSVSPFPPFSTFESLLPPSESDRDRFTTEEGAIVDITTKLLPSASETTDLLSLSQSDIMPLPTTANIPERSGMVTESSLEFSGMVTEKSLEFSGMVTESSPGLSDVFTESSLEFSDMTHLSDEIMATVSLTSTASFSDTVDESILLMPAPDATLTISEVFPTTDAEMDSSTLLDFDTQTNFFTTAEEEPFLIPSSFGEATSAELTTIPPTNLPPIDDSTDILLPSFDFSISETFSVLIPTVPDSSGIADLSPDETETLSIFLPFSTESMLISPSPSIPEESESSSFSELETSNEADTAFVIFPEPSENPSIFPSPSSTGMSLGSSTIFQDFTSTISVLTITESQATFMETLVEPSIVDASFALEPSDFIDSDIVEDTSTVQPTITDVQPEITSEVSEAIDISTTIDVFLPQDSSEFTITTTEVLTTLQDSLQPSSTSEEILVPLPTSELSISLTMVKPTVSVSETAINTIDISFFQSLGSSATFTPSLSVAFPGDTATTMVFMNVSTEEPSFTVDDTPIPTMIIFDTSADFQEVESTMVTSVSSRSSGIVRTEDPSTLLSDSFASLTDSIFLDSTLVPSLDVSQNPETTEFGFSTNFLSDTESTGIFETTLDTPTILPSIVVSSMSMSGTDGLPSSGSTVTFLGSPSLHSSSSMELSTSSFFDFLDTEVPIEPLTTSAEVLVPFETEFMSESDIPFFPEETATPVMLMTTVITELSITTSEAMFLSSTISPTPSPSTSPFLFCEEFNCNNGFCDEDTDSCECFLGWEGEFCENNIDYCENLPCDSFGSLNCSDGNSTYTCECALGYTGLNCSLEIDDCALNLCENNATCNDLGGGSGFSCACQRGFTGVLCDIDLCNPNPCQFGGTCQISEAGVQICSCPPDRNGTSCQFLIDPCDDAQSCLNNGTCNRISSTEFTCSCLPSYQGNRCEVQEISCSQAEFNSCFNNATCLVNNLLSTIDCACPPEYTGETCEFLTDPCLSRPCLNGGTCLDINAPCLCPSNLIDSECAIFLNICENLTVGFFVCICPPEFTGILCENEIDPCASNPCENNGTCIMLSDEDLACMCPVGILALSVRMKLILVQAILVKITEPALCCQMKTLHACVQWVIQVCCVK